MRTAVPSRSGVSSVTDSLVSNCITQPSRTFADAPVWCRMEEVLRLPDSMVDFSTKKPARTMGPCGLYRSVPPV